ncbi:MAG: crotonase/enoyl-CoA hydratase family protein [Pseudomonadota bacterium]
MTIKIDRDGPVSIITINRFEDARNAVDPETADALHAAFMEFNQDPEAKAGVFYGAGGAFCAGWDLKYGSTLTNKEDFDRELRKGLAFPIGAGTPPRGPMGPSRLEFDKPVIAAVEGPAVAGGMELALLADCRVMAETAYFGVYCRRWGIPLIDGGTVRLPRLVGQGKALEIAMTGRKVTAEESYRIGLCEKVVPVGKALEAALEMAHEICRYPQEAMLADRRSIIENHGQPIRDALRNEWANGLDSCINQGTEGAGRFAAGKGRSGDFSEI